MANVILNTTPENCGWGKLISIKGDVKRERQRWREREWESVRKERGMGKGEDVALSREAPS